MRKSLFSLAGALALAIVSTSAPAHGVCETFNAADPASSGYSLVFDDEFDSINSIDLNATGAPGYKWYTKQFFGGKTTDPGIFSVKKGVLTIYGAPGCNGALETACPAKNDQGYVGSVFGGAPTYFEASIAFDPALVDCKKGWPSFWGMAVEHMALKGASNWDGEPAGSERFIEDDFFEYDTADWAGKDTYGGAIHDTYGKWTKEKGFSAFSNENFVIHVPKGVDFRKFHRFGNLVIPGSKETGWRGSIQYFFDGQPTADIVTWNSKSLPGSNPITDSDAYAITDRAHQVVLLGCGEGQNMRVKSVHVWQFAKP